MLPSRTLAAHSEMHAQGMKKQKERVTAMACSNATGKHKLPLVIIGKSENPCCFKNVNKQALPVIHYAQKNVWMNTDIFSEWFHRQFVPGVKKHLKEQGLPEKALLLLDNAPAHPDVGQLQSSDQNIKTIFLPPNTTSLIQPMDQGVLEALKRRCKKSLLRELLMCDEEGQSLIDLVKAINIKNVVYMMLMHGQT